jgi:O-antigen/teichoic acid export membrane protein
VTSVQLQAHAPGRLARNTALNFAGQLLPAIAAFIAIPILVRAIGAAQFGILTLAWTAVGYFSLFDFGIGRALTHAIASRLGAQSTDDLGAVTWTALAAMFGLGMLGGTVLALGTPVLVSRVLDIPVEVQHEAAIAFYLLAAALPVLLLTIGLRGVLEAFQDFAPATVIRLPMALFSYFGPVAVLPFTHGLPAIVGSLVVARCIGLALHLFVCLRRYDFMRRIHVEWSLVRPLLGFGGWMTVSNVISPLMVNLDRFMVGALLPMASVAYYVTPYEAATKVWLIPSALLGVLFPAFAATYASDKERSAQLLDRGLRVIVAAVFPPCFLFVALGHEVITVWIGADFASHSANLLQWLAAGIFANSIAQVAFTAVQGAGRPDLTAKLHLVELPVYTLGLWLLTRAYGLTGVAIAWDLRIMLDLLALTFLARRQLPSASHALHRTLVILVALLALMAVAAAAHSPGVRLAVAIVGLLGFALFCWKVLLHVEERTLARRWLGVALGLGRVA